jgi:menaquinone-dependent protoporphyrinogen oxidase
MGHRERFDMTKILIAYGTTNGHTARIAEYLADVIQGQGHKAAAVDLKRSRDTQLDDYDAVIVGGSIHMGKHDAHVRDFVRRNRVALERPPIELDDRSQAGQARPVSVSADAHVE